MPVGPDIPWYTHANYPIMDIQAGDHFHSSIGCLDIGEVVKIESGI